MLHDFLVVSNQSQKFNNFEANNTEHCAAFCKSLTKHDIFPWPGLIDGRFIIW